MGEIMMVAAVKLPEGLRFMDPDPGRLRELHEKVDGLTAEDLGFAASDIPALSSHLREYAEWGPDGEVVPRVDLREGAEEELRAMLHRALDAVSGHGANPEITGLVLDGNRYAATGGMSSGDDPTDAYPMIALLNDSGILDEEEPEGGALPEAALPVLHLYMDLVTAGRRGDEWVAECMVHSEDGASDATVRASGATEEGARERLSAALKAMGVRTVHEDGYWGEA